jgi:GABA(A) receptor-associated protein
MSIVPFKLQHSFEQRRSESERIRDKYPDRIPIICEKASKQKDINTLDKKKYLVPKDLTIGQFMYVIRKRLKLEASDALFLFIDGHILSSNSLLGYVYDEHCDIDGFLYIKYSKESTFG